MPAPRRPKEVTIRKIKERKAAAAAKKEAAAKKKEAEKKDTPTRSGYQGARAQMDEYGEPISMAEYKKRKGGK